MWNLGRRTSHRKAALAEGYMDVVQEKDSDGARHLYYSGDHDRRCHDI